MWDAASTVIFSLLAETETEAVGAFGGRREAGKAGKAGKGAGGHATEGLCKEVLCGGWFRGWRQSRGGGLESLKIRVHPNPPQPPN